ncbi:hypothetical protein [Photobacterium phosphoreum]
MTLFHQKYEHFYDSIVIYLLDYKLKNINSMQIQQFYNTL